MRYIRYMILAILALGLIVIAVANGDMITLRLLPTVLADLVGVDWQIRVPLFVAILAGVLIGLMIGFVWEWIREMKHRSYANREHRKVVKLEKEVKALRNDRNNGDDVLALLSDSK